ncbi:unnamed protein product [Cuscuta epithymum]|uniref:Uncharacterized protein n=1 Tax=Cuscuta epithymum TaxID=186058 RepID=A0AAV0F4G1_9ASTE|nr:unnamed protein product [Cuscuta epithymum]
MDLPGYIYSQTQTISPVPCLLLGNIVEENAAPARGRSHGNVAPHIQTDADIDEDDDKHEIAGDEDEYEEDKEEGDGDKDEEYEEESYGDKEDEEEGNGDEVEGGNDEQQALPQFSSHHESPFFSHHNIITRGTGSHLNVLGRGYHKDD